MTTRSKAMNVHDENAGPKFGKSKNSTGLANKASKIIKVGRNRQVLGDISNRQTSTQEDRKSKKVSTSVDKEFAGTDVPVRCGQRATTRGETAEVESQPIEEDALEIEAAAVNLNDVLDDVDMKSSSETSLEASVAELRIDPVDAADVGNPQMVSEYINDIMAYLKKVEPRRHPSATYMSKQRDINARMREILIDWLVEVHFKFKLCDETLFLTINIIDRFLERRAVSRTKLQLVGCTAMLVASKYEEIYAPEVCDFVYISDRAYNREQILAMESIMLNTLGFHLTVPSALRFGERFCKVSGLTSRQSHLVHYLMELTCQEYKFLKYLPSIIASSAVYLARTMTHESEIWTATLETHSTYSEEDLKECVTDLYELSSRQPSKYRAVRKKYANRKFDEVRFNVSIILVI